MAACSNDGAGGAAGVGFLWSRRRRSSGRARLRSVHPAALAHDRPRGQPLLVGRRHPRRSAHLLRRRRVGRHLEDHRRRHELGADLRRPARCSRSARSPSRRPIRTSSGPAPARADPQPHLARAGRLQVHRRRAARGRSWASSRPAASRASSSIRQNPDIVLACALGHAYGPQPERGVFRTTDGGTTWTRSLFVDENTGCSDIAMDPTNPRILFAGMWQLEIHTWGRDERRPGQRHLHVARRRRDLDAAARAAACRPSPSARSAVAIAPSNPHRVYALIETGDGVPWNGPGDRERPALALRRRRRHAGSS